MAEIIDLSKLFPQIFQKNFENQFPGCKRPELPGTPQSRKLENALNSKKLLKKLQFTITPTFEHAIEMVKAFLLNYEGGAYDARKERFDKSAFFVNLERNGSIVTFTFDDMKTQFLFYQPDTSPCFGNIAKVYKFGSEKTSIPTSIPDVDNVLFEKFVESMDLTQNQYRFKIYVVEFLVNNSTFVVVDNNLHFS
jgi:hypothetical protein